MSLFEKVMLLEEPSTEIPTPETDDDSFKNFLASKNPDGQKEYADIEKTPIGELEDGTKIYSVDDGDVAYHEGSDYIGGGHGYKYKWIPTREDGGTDIIVSKQADPERQAGILFHEITEYILMRYAKWDYDKAHQYVTVAENIMYKVEHPNIDIAPDNPKEF